MSRGRGRSSPSQEDEMKLCREEVRRGQILGEHIERSEPAALTSCMTPPSRLQKETKPRQANQPSACVSSSLKHRLMAGGRPPVTAVCTSLVDHSAARQTCFLMLTECHQKAPMSRVAVCDCVDCALNNSMGHHSHRIHCA